MAKKKSGLNNLTFPNETLICTHVLIIIVTLCLIYILAFHFFSLAKKKKQGNKQTKASTVSSLLVPEMFSVHRSITSSESSAWSPAGVPGTSGQNCSCTHRSAPAPPWQPYWCPTGSRETRRMEEGPDARLRVHTVRSSWSSCIWSACFGTISSPGSGQGKRVVLKTLRCHDKNRCCFGEHLLPFATKKP